MNTAALVNSSIAWVSYNDLKKTVPSYNISEVLNLLGSSFFNQFAGLEIGEDGQIRNHNQFRSAVTSNKSAEYPDLSAVVSEEVYFLTQVILNTLNTVPNDYHNMFDIPGLEGEEWNTLAKVAQYLISQGWLESKVTGDRLLVKLTIEGKIYLRTNNAWS